MRDTDRSFHWLYMSERYTSNGAKYYLAMRSALDFDFINTRNLGEGNSWGRGQSRTNSSSGSTPSKVNEAPAGTF